MNSQDLGQHKSDALDREWRQKMISELFHLISQPVTGLHCLLEISLMKKQTAGGYRRDIQTALEATSRLTESLRQARELAEAEDPGELQEVDLSDLVRQVLEDFSPLLEATHVKQCIALSAELYVDADPAKLRHSVFYIFDSVLHDLPLGSDLFVETKRGDSLAFYIGPRANNEPPASNGSTKSTTPSMIVARRSLEAIGGHLLENNSPQGRSFWAELPASGCS